MKKAVVTILAASAALASVKTFAQDGQFYLQGEGGYSTKLELNLPQYHGLTSPSIKGKEDPSFALRGGYLAPIDDHFSLGLEAGYLNFGKVTFSNIYRTPADFHLKQQGGDLLFVTNYGFDNGLNLFGKAGYAYIKQNSDVSVYNFNVFSDKHSKALPEIAGGVGYQLTDHLTATATVNHIFGKGINANRSVVSSTTGLLGLKVNFG